MRLRRRWLLRGGHVLLGLRRRCVLHCGRRRIVSRWLRPALHRQRRGRRISARRFGCGRMLWPHISGGYSRLKRRLGCLCGLRRRIRCRLDLRSCQGSDRFSSALRRLCGGPNFHRRLSRLHDRPGFCRRLNRLRSGSGFCRRLNRLRGGLQRLRRRGLCLGGPSAPGCGGLDDFGRCRTLRRCRPCHSFNGLVRRGLRVLSGTTATPGCGFNGRFRGRGRRRLLRLRRCFCALLRGHRLRCFHLRLLRGPCTTRLRLQNHLHYQRLVGSCGNLNTLGAGDLPELGNRFGMKHAIIHISPPSLLCGQQQYPA